MASEKIERGREMDPEMKARIDRMDYEAMLRLWRNAAAGHPMFQGKAGQYFEQQMAEKRAEVGNAAHVTASKNIGWSG